MEMHELDKAGQASNCDSDYNDVPIYYCGRCLSLCIKIDEGGEDYCEDCSSTNIIKGNIFAWENLYRNFYGKQFYKHNKK